MQTIYHLYGAPATSADGVASLDIQKTGVIEAMLLEVDVGGGDALADSAQMEVSFASTRQSQVNDTKAVIGSVTITQAFLTSGGGPVSKTVPLGGLSIKVNAGERIYLHATIAGTLTSRMHAYLYVEDGVGFTMGRRV